VGECEHATWQILRGKMITSCWKREPSTILQTNNKKPKDHNM
jgi:hypothetical protein